MSAPALTQAQVAAVLQLTERRVQQMDADGDGPRRNADGKYPCSELGLWLKRRAETGHEGRLTKARADKAELEAGEMSGELVRRSKVRDDLVKKLGALRARLLTIAPMLAPRIAPKDRLAETQAEIQRAIFEALMELADE